MAEHCFIQLRERRGGDPGAVDQGWFIVKDGFVILTDEHDKPSACGLIPSIRSGSKYTNLSSALR